MDAIERIHEFDRFGMVLGLERMNVMLEKLGHPERDLKVIHVAGTNGKGSVCRYMYEALEENGYKVGLYTSPFVQCFNERIQFDRDMITDEELAVHTKIAVDKTEEMVREGYESPTEFEVVTAVAFLYFAAKKTDFVILEVGLGGIGDSTNVIEKPIISIITSISYDHMDRLGNTLAEIAGEKAGIIKPAVPVVSNVEEPEAAKVIARKAYQADARFYDATKLKYKIKNESAFGYEFEMDIYGTDYSDVKISMPGRHQVENAKTALVALELLRKQGIIKVHRDKLYKGFNIARQPGRFEVFDRQPCIVLDGAHNAAGAAALKRTVQECFMGKKIVMVTGMLADKDVDSIVDSFCEITDAFIAAEPDNPRKLPAEELALKLEERGVTFNIANNAETALKMAVTHDSKPDVVLCAGSLYLISAIRGELI